MLATGACCIAAWITGTETWRQYLQDVTTLTSLPIPKWWVSIFLPYGFLSSAIHFLRQLGQDGGHVLPIGASP
jgi:TRAP-type C4-dicarboxylate transport system permease small subunit